MTERATPEIRYRRDLRQNDLMIAAGEELEQKFETRMLAGNTIDGLLKFRIRREDDRMWFCYDITSRQPLSRLLERSGITAVQIRGLLLGIAQTLTRMEDYLLPETLVLLEPDFIYLDCADFQPALCLVPGREGDFPKEFSGFLQFLLSKTDHQDKDAVMLIYGLYQESLKDNYGLNDLLRWLLKEDSRDVEYDQAGEDAGIAAKECETGFGSDSKNGYGSEMPDNAYLTDSLDDAKINLNSRGRNGGSASDKRHTLYWVLLPVLAAAALWMWRGADGIRDYGVFVIGGAAVVAAAAAGVSLLWKKVPEKRGTGDAGRRNSMTARVRKNEERPREKTEKAEKSWEMVFAEPEPERESGTDFWSLPFGEGGGTEDQRGEPPRPSPEDNTHTVLLRSASAGISPQAELRRLSGIGGTAETVPVSYYPFLLGKQESLADYIFKEDAISRLHARIDCRDGSYWLTDLNSTNGTTLNNRLLEANETAELHIGDRVGLANLYFRFE